VNADETQRVTQVLNARRTELQALMGEWDELSKVLEGTD
jgi:hypothetical protein